MVGLFAVIRANHAPTPIKQTEIKKKLPIPPSTDQTTLSQKPSITTEPTPRAPSLENSAGKINQQKSIVTPPSLMGSEASSKSSNNINPTTTIPHTSFLTPGKPATKANITAGLNNPDWRRYGPLQVDLNNLRPLDGGNIVAPTIDEQGAQFYIAINCRRDILNSTGSKLTWRTWYFPQESHEGLLIRDICKK